MRFIIFVIDDQTEKASGIEMAAIDAFNEMLEANGHWMTAADSKACNRKVELRPYLG